MFTAIMKNEREEWDCEIPFNPTVCGWKYTGANCCDIGFVKDGLRIWVSPKRGQMRVVRGLNVLNYWKIPNNQLEFQIKANGINYNEHH